jgi:hypothetical protein
MIAARALLNPPLVANPGTLGHFVRILMESCSDGCDAFAPALVGSAYARHFVVGMDTHRNSVLALGLVPAGTGRDKKNKFHAVLREGAKAFRYGFLFGAQATAKKTSGSTSGGDAASRGCRLRPNGEEN